MGISQNTYSKWELGHVKLKAEAFPKLAEFYEMELSELLRWFIEESFVFNNHNQQGGNAANIFVGNASEQLVKTYEARIAHLEGEVNFLRSLVAVKN